MCDCVESFGRDQYRVWLDDQSVWHWELVGKHWRVKLEMGQIDIISGSGLGGYLDACEEAKRVISDYRAG